MSDKRGQNINPPDVLGLISLSDVMDSVIGVSATVLTRPGAGSGPYSETPKSLVLSVEAGSFRIQIGDTHTTISHTAPVATTSDGSAGLLLVEGAPMAVTAPSKVTVIGSDAADILTYWWI